MFKMGKERLLTTMFQSITSEERKTKLIINEEVVQSNWLLTNQRSLMLARQERL
jgi:hypothetical protein